MYLNAYLAIYPMVAGQIIGRGDSQVKLISDFVTFVSQILWISSRSHAEKVFRPTAEVWPKVIDIDEKKQQKKHTNRSKTYFDSIKLYHSCIIYCISAHVIVQGLSNRTI